MYSRIDTVYKSKLVTNGLAQVGDDRGDDRGDDGADWLSSY